MMEPYGPSVDYALSYAEEHWIANSFAKITCVVHSEEELRALAARAREAGLTVHEITDSGRTEFHGVPTLTCIAIGPDWVENIDPVTGELELY